MSLQKLSGTFSMALLAALLLLCSCLGERWEARGEVWKGDSRTGESYARDDVRDSVGHLILPWSRASVEMQFATRNLLLGTLKITNAIHDSAMTDTWTFRAHPHTVGFYNWAAALEGHKGRGAQLDSMLLSTELLNNRHIDGLLTSRTDTFAVSLFTDH